MFRFAMPFRHFALAPYAHFSCPCHSSLLSLPPLRCFFRHACRCSIFAVIIDVFARFHAGCWFADGHRLFFFFITLIFSLLAFLAFLDHSLSPPRWLFRLLITTTILTPAFHYVIIAVSLVIDIAAIAWISRR